MQTVTPFIMLGQPSCHSRSVWAVVQRPSKNIPALLQEVTPISFYRNVYGKPTPVKVEEEIEQLVHSLADKLQDKVLFNHVLTFTVGFLNEAGETVEWDVLVSDKTH